MAKHNLAILYQSNEIAARDEAMAFRLFKELAEQEPFDPDSMYELSQCYRQGRGGTDFLLPPLFRPFDSGPSINVLFDDAGHSGDGSLASLNEVIRQIDLWCGPSIFWGSIKNVEVLFSVL